MARRTVRGRATGRDRLIFQWGVPPPVPLKYCGTTKGKTHKPSKRHACFRSDVGPPELAQVTWGPTAHATLPTRENKKASPISETRVRASGMLTTDAPNFDICPQAAWRKKLVSGCIRTAPRCSRGQASAAVGWNRFGAQELLHPASDKLTSGAGGIRNSDFWTHQTPKRKCTKPRTPNAPNPETRMHQAPKRGCNQPRISNAPSPESRMQKDRIWNAPRPETWMHFGPNRGRRNLCFFGHHFAPFFQTV